MNSTKPIRRFHRALRNFGMLALLAVRDWQTLFMGKISSPWKGNTPKTACRLLRKSSLRGQQSNRESGCVFERLPTEKWTQPKNFRGRGRSKTLLNAFAVTPSSSRGSHGSCVGEDLGTNSNVRRSRSEERCVDTQNSEQIGKRLAIRARPSILRFVLLSRVLRVPSTPLAKKTHLNPMLVFFRFDTEKLFQFLLFVCVGKLIDFQL